MLIKKCTSAPPSRTDDRGDSAAQLKAQEKKRKKNR